MSDDEAQLWKNTVRLIFDELHLGKVSVFNSALACNLVNLIENRHHDYFCVPVAFEELEEKK